MKILTWLYLILFGDRIRACWPTEPCKVLRTNQSRVSDQFFFVMTLAMVVLVGGCQFKTPYQRAEPGWFWDTRGYSVEQLADETFLVTFEGEFGANIRAPLYFPYFPPFPIYEGYALRRCAELTLERGYDQFVLLDLRRREIERTWMESLKKRNVPLGVAVLIKLVRPDDQKPRGHVFQARSLLKFIGT